MSNLLGFIAEIGTTKTKMTRLLSALEPRRRSTRVHRRTSVKGIIKRTCSIQVEGLDAPGR